MTAEVAGAMNPARPLSRPLFRWKTLRTMLGASPPDKPASIQTAATTGAAAANSFRVTGGKVMRGSSEGSAPGARVTVSGESATTTAPRIVMIVRATKMMVFAALVTWIAKPASKEPRPSPPVRPTLPRIVPSFFRLGGASSTSVAVKAVVAAPPARPCRIRPAITHPTSVATRNTRFDRI
nr:hypothetical protein [Kribbella rubisoli]